MTSDGVLAHHTVVIRGDRIVAVAPSAGVALPAGTMVCRTASNARRPLIATASNTHPPGERTADSR
jgi:type III secretory pathway component EscV